MDLDIIQSLVAICLVTAVTPGPNNFMVLAASTKGGMRSAIPPYLGICIGFPMMVFTVSFLFYLIGDSFTDYAQFIKYIGSAFLIYLAIKLFFADTNHHEEKSSGDISFLQAFFFQWINPKAWAMVMSTVSVAGISNFFLPSITYFIVIFPCVGLWLLSGNFLRNSILETAAEGIINKILALILGASVLYII